MLYSLIYDTLDNRRDPRDGIYAKFTQEFAGVGGDVSFLRTHRARPPTTASWSPTAT